MKVAVITDELGYETCDTTSGVCVHHACHAIPSVKLSLLKKGNNNVNVANVLYCLHCCRKTISGFRKGKRLAAMISVPVNVSKTATCHNQYIHMSVRNFQTTFFFYFGFGVFQS